MRMAPTIRPTVRNRRGADAEAIALVRSQQDTAERCNADTTGNEYERLCGIFWQRKITREL